MIVLLFVSCSEQNKISEYNFIGEWELQGRTMFEGMRVKIDTADKKFKGRITKLNDNKIVQMFLDSNDVWVSGIKRSSNFEFKLTEKKPAGDLFSQYGLSSSTEFKAEFINENTIGLASDNSNPKKSSFVYKRISR